jgi:uncharacterized protein (DUF2236 family)
MTAATTDSGTDLGLFGPDSVTWKVHAEPVLWIAGIRAVLLQAVHPLAMAGVFEHSDFKADPWGRLFRTADYVGTVTFGTTAAAERAAARVRGIHRRVRGVDTVTGLPYAADDPDLLRWVHCCEIDSFLSVTRRAGLRLPAAEADAYVAEQATAAALVGLRTGVPCRVDELAAYFDEVRPRLKVTAAAREAVRFVLAPPLPGVAKAAAPAWFGFASLAFALLPRWARRMYRMPGLPTTDLSATVTLRALRSGVGVLPERVRTGPHLREARARVAAASSAGSEIAP